MEINVQPQMDGFQKQSSWGRRILYVGITFLLIGVVFMFPLFGTYAEIADPNQNNILKLELQKISDENLLKRDELVRISQEFQSLKTE